MKIIISSIDSTDIEIDTVSKIINFDIQEYITIPVYNNEKEKINDR